MLSSKHLPVRTTVNEFCVENYLKYGFTEEEALSAKPLDSILREVLVGTSSVTMLLPGHDSVIVLAAPKRDHRLVPADGFSALS